MKHFKTRRGAYKRELKKFGDLITFDAVDTSKVHDDVLVLEKEVLVVRDCFTGIIGAYPSDRMAKDDVVRAVKQFIGAKKVRQAYSDHAPQFIEAMNEMKIPIDHSLPGRPQTNSIAGKNEPIYPHSYFYMSVGGRITTMFLENSNPLCMPSTQRRTQR